MKNRISHVPMHKKSKGENARQRKDQEKLERKMRRSKFFNFLAWTMTFAILGGIGYALFLIIRFIWSLF